ncbi:hypothetical protein [Shewanella metallivivens]|uniref:Uncharacterized protein n=1 Tax=Shewanella metallivivens TaxID=2872342 RepID=A0ABT5TN91_9GAMM|nr:hypothetical protein [Shewanella metallivivens]MDD8060067.1 hypothetical protein [Shewanella metallivivens]
MKLYPFSNIKTNHLGLLLFAARLIAICGCLAIVVSLLSAGYGFFFGKTTEPMQLEHGLMILGADHSPGFYAFAGVTFSFVVSGILAALISMENKFTGNS